MRHIAQGYFLWVDSNPRTLGPVNLDNAEVQVCVCCQGIHILAGRAIPYCSNERCVPDPNDEGLRYGTLRPMTGERSEILLATWCMGGGEACIQLIEAWAQEALDGLAAPRVVPSPHG